MTKRNYGFLGFGKKSEYSRPSLLESNTTTQFIIVVAIGIALVSIIAGIIGIFYEPAAAIQKQVGMGILVLILIAAIFVPFTLIRRQFTNFTGKDFIFIMLAVGVLVFLLVVTPKLFNLPEIFTVSRLELAQTTQSMLGYP